MPRKLAHDWHDGLIPDNVVIHETAYVETSQSFELCRSELADAVAIGAAASVYPPTMFDVGPRGRVVVGAYAMLNGPRIICDGLVRIGDYALLSWNVILMDSYRAPLEAGRRRDELMRVAALPLAERRFGGGPEARPIRIGDNAWLGFDACVLPGVTIGEGAVVGARSVVFDDVPAYAIVAGNPARIVKRLTPVERGRYDVIREALAAGAPEGVATP
jgi:acetyltransferase-like isoleucine patch superfamily enzyme